MQDPSRRQFVGFSLFLLLIVSLWGCESIECGPGTHQEGSKCVANEPIDCDSELVEIRDGRCVPKEAACSLGTEQDPDTGLCISTGQPVTPPDEENNNVEPVEPLRCGEVAEGSVCLSGALVDWEGLDPIDGEEPLSVLLDDFTLRGAQPNKTPFATSNAEAGGFFRMENVAIASEDGALEQMILIADSEGDEKSWQRTLTAVEEDVEEGAALDDLTSYLVPASLVEAWRDRLPFTEDVLGEDTGFMLFRVIDAESGEPVSGATVTHVDPEEDGLYQKYYLGTNLSVFRQDLSTGASGAVLVLGPEGSASFTARGGNLNFRPVSGGIEAGIAVVGTLRGFP